MRNLKLTIQYDGTAYIGWQHQPAFHGTSIQQTIEGALKKILREPVVIYGAGRTDGGVHALGQTANFTTENIIPSERLLLALNHALPPDIRIAAVAEMPADFHARYRACGKTYIYTIDRTAQINVFRGHWAWLVKDELDVDLMRVAAQLFLGEHDFSQFCAAGGSAKTHTRAIDSLVIAEPLDSCDLPWSGLCRPLTVEISGSGFLYKMVRFIVSRLVAVGSGQLSLAELQQLIDNQLEKPCKPAPPQGLILKEVKY